MNVIRSTWSELVRRRLWPVALLLVVALAAIPVLLSRDPEPVAPPAESASAAATNGEDALAEPVVSKVEPEDRDRRRRVLGIRKDPFRPAKVKVKARAKQTANAPEPQVKVPEEPVTTGGGPPITGGTPVSPPVSSSPPITLPAPAPVAPAREKKDPPAGSLIVRFGDATGDELPRMMLRELEALPEDGEEEPLLVYMGLTKDSKKAIFMVDASVDAMGDGECKPHPGNCETIQLRRDETEFLDVLDPETGDVVAQYQLDLVAINK